MTCEPQAHPTLPDAGEDVFVFPASFAQQRLWLLEQRDGNQAAYQLSPALRLRGPLDRESLRRTLEAIVARHEPLRTNFRLENLEAVQVVSPSRRLDLPYRDLSGLPIGEREAAVAVLRRSESERPFDLRTDLLLRAQLLGLATEEHILLLTLHHIAVDGWSIRVLWRELETLYDAFRRGAEPALPELPVQYVDFTVWQRNALRGERLERLLDYWKKQLSGLETLDLPTDHPRPTRQSYRGASHPFELRLDVIDRLRSLSREEHVTLHMTLLAAFQTLLSRYSGQQDIGVGMPIAGRQQAELEPLIGFFVNMLVLRTDLSGDPSFRDLLARVRRVSLEAYDHQDLPFEKLVEELNPTRQLDRSPLFQVLFQLLDFPESRPALAGLDVQRLPSPGGRVRFDLEMCVWSQSDRSLQGSLFYSTDLFEASTIGRMVGHFVTLLEAVAENADRPISQLPLLTEAERQQLLVEWNATTVEHPHEKCVHDLFEQQVARCPDAVAVVFDDQEVTYRELNERSNQLAHHLRTLGVGPETLVGLCLQRSPELVAGILGILKAGGAYLPLDADYPRERLQSMLRDAGVAHLVTESTLLDRLPAGGCSMTCVDTDAARLRACDRANPAIPVTAENLAYVIFTSGSTGQPKGVAIRHASIARLVFGNDYTRFGPDRVFLQLATPSFDASTFELWGALLHGAKLVVAPPGLPDVRQLERLLKRHRVTTLWLTATLLNQVVDHDPHTLGSVEEILTGGEALSVPHICRAQAALGSRVQFVNGYGPTESTTFATCYRIPPDVGPDQESIPIGRPIGNTQVYVLDAHGQPVPIGVAGELYLGGAGLARGYLNRPELTAERFVSNPFGREDRSRLYRTGDRVRWRADGNLEFLGRLDDQVKLRGFRIELREIETVLNEHPAVKQSVVVLREDQPGEKRLVAYWVPAMGTGVDSSELKSYLRTRLPEWMVPAVFVRLDTLPLTSSGKVNRRALPAANAVRPPRRTGYLAPGNHIEQQLASIWCELLDLDQIEVDEDFFELGGHSLLAVRLFARLEDMFARKLPLATLFQARTIAQLAAILDRDGLSPDWSPLVAIQPRGSRPPLFCVHGVGGNVLGFAALAQHLDADQPVYGLQARGLDGRHAPLNTVAEMATCYVEEILKLQRHGPYFLVGQSFGGMVVYEMAQQLRAMGHEVALVGLLDSYARVSKLLPPGRRFRHAVGFLAKRLAFHARTFWHTPLRGKWRWLASRIRTLRRRAGSRVWRTRLQTHRLAFGQSDRLPPSLQNVAQSCFLAADTYAPQHYSGHVTFFRAQERNGLLEHLRAGGWDALAAEGVEVIEVPGSHISMTTEPHVRELAAAIHDRLAQSRWCSGSHSCSPVSQDRHPNYGPVKK